MSDRGTGPAPSRVVAVLGPTNTGKTHLAVERMLGHASGMIGLPLRLLAREIYDRIVKRRGVAQHPLDRQMGLAGVGGPQHRDDARGGLACAAVAHDTEKVAVPAGFLKRRREFSRSVNGGARASGTGAKRIRTESPTRPDSGFVPYNILYLKTD